MINPNISIAIRKLDEYHIRYNNFTPTKTKTGDEYTREEKTTILPVPSLDLLLYEQDRTEQELILLREDEAFELAFQRYIKLFKIILEQYMLLGYISQTKEQYFLDNYYSTINKLAYTARDMNKNPEEKDKLINLLYDKMAKG